MSIESILNVICSKAVNKEAPPIDCNLLDELLNDTYQVKQNEIKAEPDEEKQNILKSKMPVLLPSCHCKGTKNKSSVVSHTSLIGIDIDEKDNKHIPNFYELKKEFCKLPNVAYCGLSVRGKGYFLLIPIAHPGKHELHFEWLQKYFLARGLKIDPSGVNVNRLRFYSYDPIAYFNHAAKPLQSYFIPPAIVPKALHQKTFDADNKPAWVQYNEGQFFITVLENHGWKIESKRGNKIYFIRPGKDAGISAEYDSTQNVFYVFTSNGQPFEAMTGYNPFNIYTLLNHNGDHTKAAKFLLSGKTHFKPQQQTFKPSEPIVPAPKQKIIQLKQVNAPALIPINKTQAPIIPSVKKGYSMAQLIAIARDQATQTKAPKEKYFELWAADMKTFLDQSGITQPEFLTIINNN